MIRTAYEEQLFNDNEPIEHSPDYNIDRDMAMALAVEWEGGKKVEQRPDQYERGLQGVGKMGKEKIVVGEKSHNKKLAPSQGLLNLASLKLKSENGCLICQ
jgi:hypothetical protein